MQQCNSKFTIWLKIWSSNSNVLNYMISMLHFVALGWHARRTQFMTDSLIQSKTTSNYRQNPMRNSIFILFIWNESFQHFFICNKPTVGTNYRLLEKVIFFVFFFSFVMISFPSDSWLWLMFYFWAMVFIVWVS